VKDAQTYADYISYDMEHASVSMLRGLRNTCAGWRRVGPTKSGHRTPAVIVNVPVTASMKRLFEQRLDVPAGCLLPAFTVFF